MKILLLNPPTKDNKKFIREGRCTHEGNIWTALWPPISLATIASVLENDGHTVKINDCSAKNINHLKLKKIIDDFSPQIVIWSSGTPSIQSDLELSSFIKACGQSIKTATFGTHATVFAEECMRDYPDLDFIIRNEPEYTVKELISAIEGGKKYQGINGVTYRSSPHNIVQNADRTFIENLDELPKPAWHLANLDCYRVPLKGHRFVMISPLRGCPYECIFCTSQKYYGKKLRRRSPEKVLEEIEYNIKTYKIRNFFFWADTFTLDKTYVINLCNLLIDKKIDVSWVCNSRVDTVDEEMLQLMGRAGCWMISYGIESGCQEILDISKKKIRVEQVEKAVDLARKAGIKTVGHFIIGLPGETVETAQEMIKYSKSLNLDYAQFYSAVPFPGSELYRMAKENRWIQEESWEEFNQRKAIMRLPQLEPEEANNLIKKAYKSFYYKPKKIIESLKMTRLSGLWRLLLQARYIIKSFFLK